MKQLLLSLLCISILNSMAKGQELESLLDDAMSGDEINYPTLFRSSSVSNGHSVNMLPQGVLEWRIEHRFGQLNEGAYELWGLDNANIHFSFEYGINDWLMAGIGRGTYEKTYDAFIKLKPLKQSSGGKNVPISLVYQSGAYLNTLRFISELPEYQFPQRMEYVQQVLVARKFGNILSLQLAPSYLRRTPVPSIEEQINLFALGSAISVRVSNVLSINLEHYLLLNSEVPTGGVPVYNPFTLSFDLETGGHIFQLIFTNSTAMTENGMIGNTTGNWLDGDIHFGFNIARVFDLGN